MYYKTIIYEPKEDITTYELASLIHLIIQCMNGNTDKIAEINFLDNDGYKVFLEQYADIQRHFKKE